MLAALAVAAGGCGVCRPQGRRVSGSLSRAAHRGSKGRLADAPGDDADAIAVIITIAVLLMALFLGCGRASLLLTLHRSLTGQTGLGHGDALVCRACLFRVSRAR